MAEPAAENKGGRPTLLNDALASKIATHVARGLSYADACRMCDVKKRTFQRWLQWGRERSSGKFHDLVELLEIADAHCQAVHLDVIRRAATENVEIRTEVIKELPDGTKQQEVKVVYQPPTWQPSAWMLERKFPDLFGRRIIKHEGEVASPGGGGPPVVQVQFVDPSEASAGADGGEEGDADAGT